MLDPWGRVRMQIWRVLRGLEASGGDGCVKALHGVLSSISCSIYELKLWKSTRSLQSEKGVTTKT